MDTTRLQDRATQAAEDIVGRLRARSSDLIKRSGELASRSPVVIQQRRSMWPRHAAWFAGGLALGSALAYFFDPQRGNARRHMAYDRFMSAGRDLGMWGEKKARHVSNRTAGAIAEARGGLEEVQGSSRY